MQTRSRSKKETTENEEKEKETSTQPPDKTSIKRGRKSKSREPVVAEEQPASTAKKRKSPRQRSKAKATEPKATSKKKSPAKSKRKTPEGSPVEKEKKSKRRTKKVKEGSEKEVNVEGNKSDEKEDKEESKEGKDEEKSEKDKEGEKGDSDKKEKSTKGKKRKKSPSQIPMERVFVYTPFMILPNLEPYLEKCIEIRIDYNKLSTENKAYKNRHIWGDGIYTSNSDAVCILQHTGGYKLQDSAPKGDLIVAAEFKVKEPRESYPAKLANGLQSRETTSFRGYSLEFCEAEARALREHYVPRYEEVHLTVSDLFFDQHKPNEVSSVAAPEDTKLIPLISKDYAYEYSLAIFKATGVIPPEGPLNNFTKHCLYLEDGKNSYEIFKDCTEDLFTFSRASYPNELLKRILRIIESIPLKKEKAEILKEKLEWTEFLWTEDNSLVLVDKETKEEKEILIKRIINFRYLPRNDIWIY